MADDGRPRGSDKAAAVQVNAGRWFYAAKSKYGWLKRLLFTVAAADAEAGAVDEMDLNDAQNSCSQPSGNGVRRHSDPFGVDAYTIPGDDGHTLSPVAYSKLQHVREEFARVARERGAVVKSPGHPPGRARP